MEDEYRKIPKISPFKYKPPKLAAQNTLRLIAPPNISPPPPPQGPVLGKEEFEYSGTSIKL